MDLPKSGLAKGRRLIACALVAAVSFASCDGDTASQPPSTHPATPPHTPSGDGKQADSRPFDPERVSIRLEPVVESGLTSPLGLTNAGDGSGRLFVVEQGGTIRILEDGRLAATPFLDVSSLVTAGGEQGLLGLAFHPDYPRDPRFFIDYTDVEGDTVITEYRVSDDADRGDPDSARILLRIDQPYPNHNGGHVAFGPDGYLYIGMGDGGSGGDPHGNGQDLGTLLGKLLRIDVDSREELPYGIPSDNPFSGRRDARAEIWAYGLRNPWRFSFDTQESKLWIGDVGQGELEEIDRVRVDAGGLNYGWNVMEGSSCFAEPDCDTSGLVLPFTEYAHDLGCSITGGYVYRGSASPALRGGYFFSDYCSGTIWGVDAAGDGPREPTVLAETDLSVSSFGVDEEGELFVVDLVGRIFRVTGRRNG